MNCDQAEVGTATAMAAAGLMAVLNGTPRQAVGERVTPGFGRGGLGGAETAAGFRGSKKFSQMAVKDGDRTLGTLVNQCATIYSYSLVCSLCNACIPAWYAAGAAPQNYGRT